MSSLFSYDYDFMHSICFCYADSERNLLALTQRTSQSLFVCIRNTRVESKRSMCMQLILSYTSNIDIGDILRNYKIL